MRQPFRVLGNLYIPGEILELNLGYPFRISDEWGGWDWRDPKVNHSIALARWRRHDQGWHQDDGGHAEGLIVWSNMYPTEVRLPDGSIVVGQPYDVVLIDNSAVEHRTSNAAVDAASKIQESQGQPVNRYFMRGFTRKYPTEEMISEWERSIKRKQELINKMGKD